MLEEVGKSEPGMDKGQQRLAFITFFFGDSDSVALCSSGLPSDLNSPSTRVTGVHSHTWLGADINL